MRRLAALAAWAFGAAAAAQAHEPDARALDAFGELVEAYRQRPALRVHAKVGVELSQGGVASDRRDVTADFTFGRDGAGVVELRGFTCYLGDGRLAAVHESTDDAYFATPDEGAPYYALMTEFIDLPFPHLAIAFGDEDVENLLMEFHQKAPWVQPTAAGKVQRDGRTLRELKLTSDYEDMTVVYDPETKLIESIALNVTGGHLVEPGATLTYTHEYEYDTPDGPLPPETFAFEPGERQRVDMLASLVRTPSPEAGGGAEGGGVAAGEPAPGFVLATADGGALDLEDLRGRAVVLDFWATWCAPCRHALPRLHEVAEWAVTAELPVEIVTVNVWERGGPDERLEKVKAYWAQEGFTLPVAMDYSDETAGAYGVTGIPTTVVIRPDGVVHAVHAGMPPDYVDALKEEITAALE